MPAARYPQAAPLQPLGDSCNITPEQRLLRQQLFEVKVNLLAMHADIGDDAFGTDRSWQSWKIAGTPTGLERMGQRGIAAAPRLKS